MSTSISGDVQFDSNTSSATSHCHKVDLQGSIGFDGEWVLRRFFCDGTGDTINLERRLEHFAEVEGTIEQKEGPVTVVEEEEEELPEYKHHAMVKQADLRPTEEQRFQDAAANARPDQPRTLRKRSRQHSHGTSIAGLSQVRLAGPKMSNRKRSREPSTLALKPELTHGLDNYNGDNESDEDKPPPPKRLSSNGRAISTAEVVPETGDANNDEQDGDVVGNVEVQAPAKKTRAKRAESVHKKEQKPKKATKKMPSNTAQEPKKNGRKFPNLPKLVEAEEDEVKGEDEFETVEEDREPQTVPKGEKKVG